VGLVKQNRVMENPVGSQGSLKQGVSLPGPLSPSDATAVDVPTIWALADWHYFPYRSSKRWPSLWTDGS